MSASNAPDRSPDSPRSARHGGDVQPPNLPEQGGSREPTHHMGNTRLGFDSLTISEHGSRRNDLEVRCDTNGPPCGQDRGPGGRDEQRQQLLNPVALAENTQLNQLRHSGSSARQHPHPSAPQEPTAQVQSGGPSSLLSLTINAENGGDQQGMQDPGRPASNAPSWSDARYEGTDYTDVDSGAQTRERSTLGSECQSEDADTTDEGSVVERGRSRAPRETTPWQGLLNTSLGMRREAGFERIQDNAEASVHGRYHSGTPPSRDTRQSIPEYGRDDPYFSPSGKEPHALAPDGHYGRQGSLQSGAERESYYPPKPPFHNPGDSHGIAEPAPTVNRLGVLAPETGRPGMQPTLVRAASGPAPPQPRTVYLRNDARGELGPPFPAGARRISSAPYNRERSLSVSSFDRLPAQISSTAPVQLQRQEDRGYNMNPRISRRPATHRNFAQPAGSSRGMQESQTQHQPPRRPLGGGIEEENAWPVSMPEEPEHPPHRRLGYHQERVAASRYDGQERSTRDEMGEWRTLIPQARRVLGQLGEFLSPALRDGLTRLAIRAADLEVVETPNPNDLPHRAGRVGAAEYGLQPNHGAWLQEQQDTQAGDSQGVRVGSSRPEGGDRGGKTELMGVRNSSEGQIQRQEQGSKIEGAATSPEPPKVPGKRPPGRPRKDDPYRPEPRRKSIAPLPGEKPHVGRPKNVEIKTREQYHGGKMDYSTAVDAIKTVSKGTQFVPTSTSVHNASTGLNLPVPEPKPTTRRAPVARPVPRVAQMASGEDQAQNPFQLSTGVTGQSNPQSAVVEYKAPSSQIVGVGVRGQFPGGTPIYIYRDGPEQVIQSSPKSAIVDSLRRSARTASRQGSAQPIATSSRPQPVPALRSANAATGAARPLHQINETMPPAPDQRRILQHFTPPPPSQNTLQQTPVGPPPTIVTRIRDPQQPAYAQEREEGTQISGDDASSGQQAGLMQEVQRTATHVAPATRSSTKRKSPSGEASDHSNGAVSPKKQRSSLRRSPRGDHVKGERDGNQGSQGGVGM